ncbi:MAG: hypothetical protein ABSC05_07035 [Candidatus Solibacter sp.]|jgi:hypothetical protein
MIAFEVASWRAAVIGRWTARIAGALMLLLFLAFFFGEGPPNVFRLTATERVQFLGMAGLFLGLAIAWKWEGLGGLITVAGFTLLAAVSGVNLRAWALWVPAIAGAVHIASWGRLRAGAPAGLAPWRLPRSVVLSLLAALAAFLLLCANEMFGQPPLMTPALHPGSDLLGAWHGRTNDQLFPSVIASKPVEIAIQPEGLVTGTIGDATLAGSRITYGRSWFGRLLHMNAPYIIKGKLASAAPDGDRFTVPLEIRGGVLQGTLFVRNRPIGLMLTRRLDGRF